MNFRNIQLNRRARQQLEIQPNRPSRRRTLRLHCFQHLRKHNQSRWSHREQYASACCRWKSGFHLFEFFLVKSPVDVPQPGYGRTTEAYEGDNVNLHCSDDNPRGRFSRVNFNLSDNEILRFLALLFTVSIIWSVMTRARFAGDINDLMML